MKKSISYWAFPGGMAGEMPLEAAMTQAKELGFEAIELAVGESGHLTFELSDGMIKEVGAAAQRIGIEISSLASVTPFTYQLTSTDRANWERSVELVGRMLKMARLLGTDAILVVSGSVQVAWDPGAVVTDYDDAYDRMLQGLKRLAPIAEENRVYLGLENVWNYFLLSPLEVRDLLDKVGSPYVGAYLDVGNVIAYGFPEQWIKILGKRIKRVHLKDFRRSVGTLSGFVGLLEGDVNWRAVMEGLRKIGYDSYLTAEVFPPADRYQAMLANTSRSMDYILGR